MKRQGLSIFFAFYASLMAISCSQGVSDNVTLLPYVSDILSDSDSNEYLSLSSFDAPRSKGNIVILDDSDRADSLSLYFASADFVDNITGSSAPDLLPDFAGENILAIHDNGNAPYSDFLPNVENMRTTSVKAMLSTLDSLASSKLTVLSSPFMAAFGVDDIDTLIDASSCRLNVVMPLKLAVEKTRGAYMIGVLGDSDAAKSGVYEKLFGSERVHVFAVDSTMTITDIFIDCDVVVVDNFAVEPGSFTYGNARIVDTRELAAREVYRLMRADNIFTHFVKYPSRSALRTDFRGDYSLYDVQD